jgi:glycosyltransferase involved in cell wall biosynthesis
MLQPPLIHPRRVLLTLDAVGGVWRYALDVARCLEPHGVTCLLVGFGPEPIGSQQAECDALANTELVWTHEPLDWMVAGARALDPGVQKLAALAKNWDADLLHLNLPSQATGLVADVPVVVASHSCVPTWWEAVRGGTLPAHWRWQYERTRDGFHRADAVVVPSASHGAALSRVYGKLPTLHVVYNGTQAAPITPDWATQDKEAFILAVGRWWDAGKNGAVLNAAAPAVAWPIVLAGPLSGPNGQSAAFGSVQAPGALPHRDVLVFMRRAAIFAAPSRYEPFGLAVAEAAMCGAALVLADIPTFRELWEDAAVFVDTDDTTGWSRALSTLAADDTQRRQLAARAATRARQFTLPRQAAGLDKLYSSLGTAALT